MGQVHIRDGAHRALAAAYRGLAVAWPRSVRQRRPAVARRSRSNGIAVSVSLRQGVVSHWHSFAHPR